MMHSVVALVGDTAAAFELGIVCQVFGLDRSDDGLPVHDFAVCGPVPGAVPGPVPGAGPVPGTVPGTVLGGGSEPGHRIPTTSGFSITVGAGLDRLATADLITIPAWPALDAPLPAGVAEALRAAFDRGAILLSICSGAFALAGAGLLDGRRATTHWQFADRLGRRYPQVTVDRDVLYVDAGQVLTSAGASAGIDACLHLVRREYGAVIANRLARRMVVPAHRAGGQAQYVEMPVPAAGGEDPLAELIDWMQTHLDQPLTADVLARRAHLSARTFARRFRETTGTTPHRWLLDQRLQRAEELLETTDLPVDAVAVRAGFGSGDTLRHHFAVRRGTGPAEHRRAFRH